MSIRTPLARVRGLGAAKDGTHHFWVQRLTAIALIPLTIWFVIVLTGALGMDRAQLAKWMRSPSSAAPLALFLIAGFWHLKLGLQVVIEDYVHHEGWKTGLIIAMNLAVVTLGVTGLASILFLAMGG
jgi:succinate dehydrogenase / fumarate reductase, membrane anchor subunit